jgi:hypothetical protein
VSSPDVGVSFSGIECGHGLVVPPASGSDPDDEAPEEEEDEEVFPASLAGGAETGSSLPPHAAIAIKPTSQARMRPA